MSEEIETAWKMILQKLVDQIEKHGQSVQLVDLNEDDPPDAQAFMYTIGNHAHGLPELLIVGTAKKEFVDILNKLAKLQRERGRAFEDEELVSVGDKFPLRVVDGGEIGRAKYGSFVGIFYGTRNYSVRQVVLPDTRGHWPDVPGCEFPYSQQPILSAIGRSKQ